MCKIRPRRVIMLIISPIVRAVSTMAGATLFCTRSTLPAIRGWTRLGQGSWVTRNIMTMTIETGK